MSSLHISLDYQSGTSGIQGRGHSALKGSEEGPIKL